MRSLRTAISRLLISCGRTTARQQQVDSEHAYECLVFEA